MIRRALLLAIPLAVLTPGGYALLCSLTDTWRELPPSAHVMYMALLAISGAIIAIIFTEVNP